MKQESYFDGGLLSYIGHCIIASLITICTLGICAPWGICIMINWKVKQISSNAKVAKLHLCKPLLLNQRKTHRK
jgi:uncharacterized membrane protein YjgN (DUF898 family)